MNSTYKKELLSFALLLIIILLLNSGCSNQLSYSQPVIKNGYIDLTKHQFNQSFVNLDGEWEFYWNQLLKPDDFNNANIKPDYINVPSSWNKKIINGTLLSGDGIATYKLEFKTKGNEKLALKMPRIFTAYNLWINGEALTSAGKVDDSREKMSPQYLPRIVLFDSQEGINQIVIQVSNYYHRSGGILEGIILGEENQILSMRYKKIAYELLLFGSLIIMGLYHLCLFFFRTKNTSPLYFGLFCLFIGIRTLFVGERFFLYLYRDFNWEVAHKIQTLTFYLGLSVILTFFMSVFPAYFRHKIVRAVQLVGVVFGITVILTPAKFFTLLNPIYQIITLAVSIYIVITFIIILSRKEKDIMLIMWGGLALITTSLNDVVYHSIWMNDNNISILRAIIRTGNLSSVGQLLFIFANSLVLARRFSKALGKEEIATAQLKEVNLNLDKLVTERTKALEESRSKIEFQRQELEKANHELQLLIIKDPLTGLWNRRHYDYMIQREWNRCQRYEKPITLLMIDIDYFKEYNDYYGHKAGDDCLTLIAQEINNLFYNSNGLAARYGGEEFIVIMAGLYKDEAVSIGKKVQKSVEKLRIPHEYSSISPFVTISIGISSIIPNSNCSCDELFLSADKALYQAKEAGRNQVKYAHYENHCIV